MLADDDVCRSVGTQGTHVHIFLHTSQWKTNDDDDDGGGCGWMEKGELDSIFALVVVVTLAFHGASFFPPVKLNSSWGFDSSSKGQVGGVVGGGNRAIVPGRMTKDKYATCQGHRR